MPPVLAPCRKRVTEVQIGHILLGTVLLASALIGGQGERVAAWLAVVGSTRGVSFFACFSAYFFWVQNKSLFFSTGSCWWSFPGVSSQSLFCFLPEGFLSLGGCFHAVLGLSNQLPRKSTMVNGLSINQPMIPDCRPKSIFQIWSNELGSLTVYFPLWWIPNMKLAFCILSLWYNSYPFFLHPHSLVVSPTLLLIGSIKMRKC